MKKWFNVIVRLAIIGLGIHWLVDIYIDRFYNDPIAVADRLTNISEEIFRQKEEEAQRLSKSDKTVVFIDPYAGGNDEGLSYEGVCEKDITLQVALYVQDLMKGKNDIEIFLTRDKDVSLSDAQRDKLLEIIDPECAIRLVLADEEAGNIFGTEVLYSDEYYNYRMTNAEFAASLEQNICENAKTEALGVINISEVVLEANSDKMSELLEAKDWLSKDEDPMAIIKLGYLSNENEREALDSPIYQKNLARGIVVVLGELKGTL